MARLGLGVGAPGSGRLELWPSSCTKDELCPVLRQAPNFTIGEGMNRTQCRMARAALDWSLDDLAEATKAVRPVSRRTIAKFEAGQSVSPETVETLRATLVREGIAFENGGKRAGVSYLRRD